MVAGKDISYWENGIDQWEEHPECSTGKPIVSEDDKSKIDAYKTTPVNPTSKVAPPSVLCESSESMYLRIMLSRFFTPTVVVLFYSPCPLGAEKQTDIRKRLFH